MLVILQEGTNAELRKFMGQSLWTAAFLEFTKICYFYQQQGDTCCMPPIGLVKVMLFNPKHSHQSYQ